MIYDISVSLSAHMPVWPGDPQPVIEQIMCMDQGEIANVSGLNIGVHLGTHVDAPHHFMNDQRTVESLSLAILTGACWVAQFADQVSLLTAEVLEQADIPEGVTRLLCQTRNSRLWADPAHAFAEDFVAISEDGAQWLLERHIQLVGVDYLSVAPYRAPVPTHRTLLGAGVIVVEGLDLRHVPPGGYDLYCLPLKIEGADGAPARVILVS